MHQNILQNISQNGWYFAEYSDAFFFHASMCSPEATMTPLTDSPTAERSQKSAGVNMKKKKNNDPVSLTQRKARRCTRCDNGQNQDNEDPQCDIHLTTIQQLDLIDINWCPFEVLCYLGAFNICILHKMWHSTLSWNLSNGEYKLLEIWLSVWVSTPVVEPPA